NLVQGAIVGMAEDRNLVVNHFHAYHGSSLSVFRTLTHQPRVCRKSKTPGRDGQGLEKLLMAATLVARFTESWHTRIFTLREWPFAIREVKIRSWDSIQHVCHLDRILEKMQVGLSNRTATPPQSPSLIASYFSAPLM